MVDPDFNMYEQKTMRYSISNVLEEGMVFSHEYDYGTTTTLRLDVKAAGVPPLIKEKGIVLLAMHDDAKFVCDECGGEATQVCGMCSIYEDGSLLCDGCMDKHACNKDGEGYGMAVVQSPRVGMCGYYFESRLPQMLNKKWGRS